MMCVYSTLLWVVALAYCAILLLFIIGLCFPRRGVNQRLYSVSVIIAARNEEENIERCLQDLIHQTYPKDKYQIIIVDDNSEDNTRGIVQKYAQTYQNILYVRADTPAQNLSHKKYALNCGIQRSAGELILTTDADCRVRSTWIETMVSYFTPKVGMVIGFSQLGLKYTTHTLFEKLQALDFLALMAGAAGSCNLHNPLACSGQNLAYRRCVYEEIGGFTSIAHRISGDDVLFLQLVRKLSAWQIRFASSHRAFNSSQPEKTVLQFLHQRTRWASNGAYQLIQNIPFFIYIIAVYAFNLLLLSGAVLIFLLPHAAWTLVQCLACKMLVEFVLILRGAKYFNRADLIRYFPLWTILQIPYVVIVGTLGTFGSYQWKGRWTDARAGRSQDSGNAG